MSSSAQRKLARGIKHVKTLRRQAASFESADAYIFGVQRDLEPAKRVECRCYAEERQAPPDHWPLLAGEAIQNLRSALDHVVWASWEDAGGIGDGDHVKFPIAVDINDFKSQAGNMLRGVPKPIWTLIEGAQPYQRAPTAPPDEALYVLRSLSNIDKHRTLAAIAVAVEHEILHHRTGIEFEYKEFATNKPLGHGKTEVSWFVATSETEILAVDVYPEFTYEVRIEGMPMDTLVWIARRVFESVTSVETGQRLHPFATYPI